MNDDYAIVIPATYKDYQEYLHQALEHYGPWIKGLVFAAELKDPPISSRILRAIAEIDAETDTEFILLSAIDDQMNYSALLNAHRHMVALPNITAASGQMLMNDKVMYPHLKAGFFSHKYFWKNYVPVIWGLHQREVLIDACKFTEKYSLDDNIELMIALQATACGEIYITADPFGTRAPRRT